MNERRVVVNNLWFNYSCILWCYLKNCVKKIVCKIIWLGLGKKWILKLLVIYLIRIRKYYIFLYLVVRNVIDICWCNFLWIVFCVYKYLLKWCYWYLFIKININLLFFLVRINEDDFFWFIFIYWRFNLYLGGVRWLLFWYRWCFNFKWLYKFFCVYILYVFWVLFL